MFDIAFIADEPVLEEEAWLSLCGRITLGDYSECFWAPLDPWRRADYERQWLDAAHRLLHEADRTGFFTQAYWMWWTMWREGSRVFVHEEFIPPERYGGPYDGSVPYHIIGPRGTHSDDGEMVSEWEISVDDIREFLGRRKVADEGV